MADQLSFASLDFAAKKKRTKRNVFIAEMTAAKNGAQMFALLALAKIYLARCRLVYA